MSKKPSRKTPEAKEAAAEEVNPAEAKEIVRTNFKRETIAEEEFVSLYVNDTQVQITPWDFRFLFGVISNLPTKENPTMTIKTLGEIRMSPQHAKKVLSVLLQQVKNYEENIGAISIPTD